MRLIVVFQSILEALQYVFDRRARTPIFVPATLDEVPHVVCQAPFNGDGIGMAYRTLLLDEDSLLDLNVVVTTSGPRSFPTSGEYL